ncbi:hypothetical protein CHH27_01035 [Labrenzia sp. VG12]|nr:hypothetical protein CHH27_01035 [Labrenzia sp. VG12]
MADLSVLLRMKSTELGILEKGVTRPARLVRPSLIWQQNQLLFVARTCSDCQFDPDFDHFPDAYSNELLHPM